jgi:p-aminobenzoyl-glutamate transporter AbgT
MSQNEIMKLDIEEQREARKHKWSAVSYIVAEIIIIGTLITDSYLTYKIINSAKDGHLNDSPFYVWIVIAIFYFITYSSLTRAMGFVYGIRSIDNKIIDVLGKTLVNAGEKIQKKK